MFVARGPRSTASWLETGLSDLRHAGRALWRSPVYTSTAVLTLALGIAATTAGYSVVGTVLLKPLPYDEPQRLVNVWSAAPQVATITPSYPDFVDFREQSGAFDAAAFATGTGVTLRRPEGATQLLAGIVSDDFFTVLRARPALGRTFGPADFAPGAAPAGVLSYGTWASTFGSDPRVIGRTLDLDIGSFTVVGVLRPGQAYPEWVPGLHTDLYVPLAAVAFVQPALRNRGNHADSRTIARLRPGVTIDEARRRLTVVAARLAAAYPASDSGLSGNVTPLQQQVVGDIRPALGVLTAAVLLLFLLATSDVANLTLVRALAGSRELGVRAALGAGYGRLARYMLTESLIIAVGAAAVGVGLAVLAVHLLVATSPGDIPRIDEIAVDGRAIFVGIAAASVAVMLCGLTPLATLDPTRLAKTLRGAGRGTAGTRHGLRIRGGIVIGQLATSMVLVIGAGLMVRSFANLRRVDVGFDPSHVIIWHMGAPRKAEMADPANRFALYKRELAAASVPGVVTGSLVNHAPIGGAGVASAVGVDGADPTADSAGVGYVTVAPHYFATMKIPLLYGRDFSDADMTPNAAVAIVTRAMVRRYWREGTNPVGRQLTVLNGAPHDKDFLKPIAATVIGVVGDVRRSLTDDRPDPLIYMPYTRPVWGGADIVVRTAGPPATLIATIRRAVTTVDPDVSPTSLDTAGRELDAVTTRQRFTTTLLSGFSLVALVLASLGLYGVLAYTVSQRVPEIGIRMALGARRAEIIRLILGSATALVAIGLVVGLAGAVLLARSMRSLLFGIVPLDPITFIGVTTLLAAVGLLATYIPARRAARIDPIRALRAE